MDTSYAAVVAEVRAMTASTGPYQLVTCTDPKIPKFTNWPRGRRGEERLMELKPGDTIYATLRESDYGGERRFKAIHIEYRESHGVQEEPAPLQPMRPAMPVEATPPSPGTTSKDGMVARSVAVKAVVELAKASMVDIHDPLALKQWLDYFTRYVLTQGTEPGNDASEG